MKRLALGLLMSVSLSARAQPAGGMPLELPASLSSTLKDLLNDLRNRRPAQDAPAQAKGGANTGRLVSWNVQTLGRKASATKKEALRRGLALALDVSGPVLLAAQEIANDAGSEVLERQLPNGGRGWTSSFEDTRDAQDNALYFGPGVRVDCAATLALEGVVHPPRMAHVTVGEADFTVLSVHLTYAKGDASASSAELERILSWARAEMARPGADPDFVIAGDFNLPSRRGKTLSVRASDRSWEPIEGVLGKDFVVLVDEPTSRSGREDSANNYDHFIVSRSFADSELVEASALGAEQFGAVERDAGARASDHFPIALTFLKSGAGRDGRPIAAHGPSTCR